MSRVTAARIVVCLGLAAGLVMSRPLWLTARELPHFPCFAWLPPFPAPWDSVLFWLAVASAVLGACLPRRRAPLVALLAVAALLSVQDQLRWQPWWYLYLLCLVPTALLSPDARRDERAALASVLRLVLVAVWFWSCWHKLGEPFARFFASSVVGPLGDALPAWVVEHAETLGWLVAPFEIVLAVCMAVPRLRRVGVPLAVLLHGSILVWFGLVSSTNAVIWPWNACMIGLAFVLFGRASGERWRAPRSAPLRLAALAVLWLVWVMPALSASGRWDQYLSFHLYSGRGQRFLLVVPDAAVERLSPLLQRYCSDERGLPGHHDVDFLAVTLGELRVPLPPEDRILLQLGKWVARRELAAADAAFFYRDFGTIQERGWDRYGFAEMLALPRFPPFRQAAVAPRRPQGR